MVGVFVRRTRQRRRVRCIFGGLEIQILEFLLGIGLDLDANFSNLRAIKNFIPRRELLVIVRARRTLANFRNLVGLF